MRDGIPLSVQDTWGPRVRIQRTGECNRLDAFTPRTFRPVGIKKASGIFGIGVLYKKVVVYDITIAIDNSMLSPL